MRLCSQTLSMLFKQSLPMMLALVAQNAIGFVDAVMVGKLGSISIASVGIANFIIILHLTIPMGLAAGMQTVMARRIGEGKQAAISSELLLGLLLSGFFGLLMALLCFYSTPLVLSFISEDKQISQQVMAYCSGRIPSIFLTAVLLGFRAYWIAQGKLRSVIWMLYGVLIANTLFNYIFIFGHFSAPSLGVLGAGLAASLASLVGLVIALVFWRSQWSAAYKVDIRPSYTQVLTLVKVAIPESINLFFMSLAILLLFAIVGQLGVQQLAILQVLINFILFAHLLVEGIGLTTITLVGQAMGSQNYLKAQQIGWSAGQLGALLSLVLGLALICFPTFILSAFFSQADIIHNATVPMRLLGIWIWIDVYAKIIGFALIGAGATKWVLAIMFTMYWVIGIPAQWFVGVILKMDLYGVFMVPLGVSLICSTIFASIWKSKRWQQIKI